MHKLLVLFLSGCLLFTAGACSADDSTRRLLVNKGVASASSSESAESPVESIAEIMKDAETVEYLSQGEWISADRSSAEGKKFTDSLTALFPDRFSEVAAAYMPENIVIKVQFQETSRHNVNVNSTTPTSKEVEISAIEIDQSGLVFLLPQGTALGAVKNIDTILDSAKEP